MSESTDEKIADIERYVNERQLAIAGFLAKEFENDGSESPLKQSGYAILAIVVPYFEMYQQFKTATESVGGKSGNMFDEGFEAVVAKFIQNSHLLEFLLGTGDAVLVEASPYDRIWGIGLKADDERAKDPVTWQGQNLLGFALMDVREELA
ncbi:NADAR family protein [Rhodopirellula bahusiensis]|nr:NADAR family protein [Rhodopirellula bahusiensis]